MSSHAMAESNGLSPILSEFHEIWHTCWYKAKSKISSTLAQLTVNKKKIKTNSNKISRT